MSSLKKLIIMFSISVVIFITAVAFSGCSKKYGGGSGTENSPYLINNSAHLKAIGEDSDKCFKLTNNIDLGDENINPIGSFSGVLDGDGFTISNLKITSIVKDRKNSSTYDSVGLFTLNSGVIKNLNLSKVNVKASPVFNNRNQYVRCGAIAGNNTGKILNCNISDAEVVGNSSDIADIFKDKYYRNPCDLGRSSSGWEEWISQSYCGGTNSWQSSIKYQIFSGGIVGENSGEIFNCSMVGKVESNLYNMRVSDTIEQVCIAGGIAGVNHSVVKNVTVEANVSCWLELDNDGGGLGWVTDIYPHATGYAGGLVGGNKTSATVLGEATGRQSVSSRIYAPQCGSLLFPDSWSWASILFWKIKADYQSDTKGHKDNVYTRRSDTYCMFEG